MSDSLFKALREEQRRLVEEAEDRYTRIPYRWRKYQPGDPPEMQMPGGMGMEGEGGQGGQGQPGQGQPGGQGQMGSGEGDSANPYMDINNMKGQGQGGQGRPQPQQQQQKSEGTGQGSGQEGKEQKDEEKQKSGGSGTPQPEPKKDHEGKKKDGEQQPTQGDEQVPAKPKLDMDHRFKKEYAQSINTTEEKEVDRRLMKSMMEKLVQKFAPQAKEEPKPEKHRERKFKSYEDFMKGFDLKDFLGLDESYDPYTGVPSLGRGKTEKGKDVLSEGLLVNREDYNRKKIEHEKKQMREAQSGERNVQKAYDIKFLRERRLERDFSVVVAKLAEDLGGWPKDGDDEWDVQAIIKRTMDRRPLSHCRQSREKRSIVVLLDTSGSCYCQADFYRKVATAAIKEGDVELYTAPNASVQQRYTHDAEWVNLDKSYDIWPFKGRTIIFFGDFDGAQCICNASKTNKIYWFCSENRYKKIEDGGWSGLCKDSDFHGIRYRDVFQEEDFIRLAKKLR
jgi:hypothetical protein